MDGFEGPLDLLLELARRQRVDLARISVTMLVEQYLDAVTIADRTDLMQAADWLVMAAWLIWLKSRLLVELERVQAAADWLSGQPQLGWDMFERGDTERPDAAAPAGTFMMLMEACAAGWTRIGPNAAS